MCQRIIMNVLGYLITLSNLQNTARTESIITDMNVQLGSLDSLASELRSIPNIPEAAFKKNGRHRVGDVEIYASKNLQDYMYKDIGDPDEESIVIKMYYSSPEPNVTSNQASHNYFLYDPNISDDDKKLIQDNIQTLKNHRNKSVGK